MAEGLAESEWGVADGMGVKGAGRDSTASPLAVALARTVAMAPNRDQIASLGAIGTMLGMVGSKSTVLVTMVASDRSGVVNSALTQKRSKFLPLQMAFLRSFYYD